MRNVVLVLLLIGTLLLAGCAARSIEEAKSEALVGERIVVSGIVQDSLKIGELSGFTLADESGEIKVASEELPAEGDSVTVRGTLMRDSLFGYYVERDD